MRGTTRPIALYAGLHGLAQGLDQVLEAARRMENEPAAEIFLVGDGPVKEELMSQARKMGLEHVHFIEPVAASEMPAWLASSDIALVPLKQDLPGAVPSKLYEAMASGAAVLLAASGEAEDIVRTHQAGIVVAPGDATGMTRALQTLGGDPVLRERLGANGRRAAVANYDRRTIVADFVQYLEESQSSK
jgi:glycosyltransferase involved in cell wall biosynthesis